MPNQELSIVLSGLHTAPSAYGASPPGALRTADNVVIRSPGVVQPRPGFLAQPDRLPGFTAAWALFDYREGVAIGAVNAPGTDTMYYGDSDTAVKNSDGTVPAWTRGRIQAAAARKNLYLTAFDFARRFTGTPSEGLARIGAPAPLIAVVADSTSGSLVSAGQYYSYRAVTVRKNGDLIVRSAPSNRVIYGNEDTGSGRSVTIRVWLHQEDDNDVSNVQVELYRSTASASDVVPDEHFLIATYGPTADADLSFTITDDTPDTQLGRALYTNDDEEGIDNANIRPPKVGSIAEYNGSLVLGDLTFPPNFGLQYTYTDGLLASTVAGIGERDLTGTYTNGSAVVTAVASTAGFLVGMIIIDTVGEWSAATDYVTVVSKTANSVTFSRNYSGATGAKTRTVCDSIKIAISTNNQYFPIRERMELGIAPYWSSVSLTGETYQPSEHVYVTTPDVFVYRRTVVNEMHESPFLRTLQFNGIDPIADDVFTISATHGSEYYPPLEEPASGSTFANIVSFPSAVLWSKYLEPEHFSVLDLQQLGDDVAEVWAMPKGGDGLWVLKQDGMWRMNGASRDAGFRLDRVTSARVLHPNAAVESGDQAFAWSNQGLLALAGGVSQITSAAVRDRLNLVQASPTEVDDYGIWVAANTKHSELIVSVPASESVTEAEFGVSGELLVLNMGTNAWTRWPSLGASCMVQREAFGLLLGTEGEPGIRPDTILRREVMPYELVQHCDTALALEVTAVNGRVLTVDEFLMEGDAIVSDSNSEIYYVVSTVDPVTCTVDREGFVADTAVAYRNDNSYVIEPVACTAKNPSVLKLWADGSWLFGSLYGLSKLLLTFESSRGQGSTQVTKTLSGVVSEDSALLDTPRSVRFLVPRAHARSEQVFPAIEIRSAGAPWRIEGMSLFYRLMSQRTGNR